MKNLPSAISFHELRDIDIQARAQESWIIPYNTTYIISRSRRRVNRFKIPVINHNYSFESTRSKPWLLIIYSGGIHVAAWLMNGRGVLTDFSLMSEDVSDTAVKCWEYFLAVQFSILYFYPNKLNTESLQIAVEHPPLNLGLSANISEGILAHWSNPAHSILFAGILYLINIVLSFKKKFVIFQLWIRHIGI